MNKLIITALTSIALFSNTTYAHAYTHTEYWAIKKGCQANGQEIGVYPDGKLGCYGIADRNDDGIKPASEAGASTKDVEVHNGINAQSTPVLKGGGAGKMNMLDLTVK